ncbi:MAG TPA: hypothetical protein VK196_14595, partial [Magnetospirillum sp.]|nr:hypothetical protein [Magnetospirillum sp.]
SNPIMLISFMDGPRLQVVSVQRPLWRIATPVSRGRPPHHCGRGQAGGYPRPARENREGWIAMHILGIAI